MRIKQKPLHIPYIIATIWSSQQKYRASGKFLVYFFSKSNWTRDNQVVCYSVPMDHPEYKHIGSRLRTFATWPKNIGPEPVRLSRAGFYYSGVADRVICFSCGIGIRDWSPIDDPWQMHVLMRPNRICAFLLEQMGMEYVQAIRTQFHHCPQLPSHADVGVDVTAPPPQLPPPDADVADKDDEDRTICKICLLKPYEIVFVPCGHILACSECARNFSKCCPLCRSKIEKKIKIYFP